MKWKNERYRSRLIKIIRNNSIIAYRSSFTCSKRKIPIFFNEILNEEIKVDISKYYQKILIAYIIQGKRSDNPYQNTQKMKEILEKLKRGKKEKFKKII